MEDRTASSECVYGEGCFALRKGEVEGRPFLEHLRSSQLPVTMRKYHLIFTCYESPVTVKLYAEVPCPEEGQVPAAQASRGLARPGEDNAMLVRSSQHIEILSQGYLIYYELS